MVWLQIRIPEAVQYIMDELEGAGFEAYAVGGCVRDSILQKEPLDWDITTSAGTDAVRGLFARTIDTGAEHGTVTVMLGRTGYEVTTYRIDGAYKDGRHPQQVAFTKNLAEDLRRRDFTINAMAYHARDGLIDLYGGLADIQDGVIRCVGSAGERFWEDALRMLRAVRFAAQLHFTIEEGTRQAVVQNVHRLALISAERIRTECNKILLSKHPEIFLEAYELGITNVVLPEFDAMARRGAHRQALRALQYLQDCSGRFDMLAEKQKQSAVWALLLHGIPAEEGRNQAEQAVEILRRFKFDNETIDTARRLLTYFMYPYDRTQYGLSPAGIRQAAGAIGKDRIGILFLLQEADAASMRPADSARLHVVAEAARLYREILDKGECFSLKDLAVKGDDLVKAGHPPGPALGRLLNRLLESVIVSPAFNQKELLLQKAMQWAEASADL